MKKGMETSFCVSFCALLCLSLFLGCSESNTAGATSETTNGIAFKVVDSLNKPFACAQMKVYSKDAFSVIDSALSDSNGRVSFNDKLGICTDQGCFVEALAGEDSAFMSWSPVDFADTSVQKIALLPSASLIVRTGVSAQEIEGLLENVQLESTPYFANRFGSEYVFAHVPAGSFTIVAGDSTVAEVALAPNESADTLVPVPGKSVEYVFEDFDDGDSLNNLAKTYPNYGWYFNAVGKANFAIPDSAESFSSVLKEDKDHGKYLAVKFAIDTGFVLLGTHLGLDTGFFDLSNLTAIRLTVRGDCELNIALENLVEKIDLENESGTDFIGDYESLKESEFLFLLNLIDSLKDDGIMAVSISENFLFKNSLETLRKYLTCKKNYIDTIIRIPNEIVRSRPEVVIVFKKNRTNKDILFIDMAADYETQRSGRAYRKGDCE